MLILLKIILSLQRGKLELYFFFFLFFLSFAVHGAIGCGQKKLHASVAAPVRVPSQRPLALSVASVMLVANDRGDNEMIPGAV